MGLDLHKSWNVAKGGKLLLLLLLSQMQTTRTQLFFIVWILGFIVGAIVEARGK